MHARLTRNGAGVSGLGADMFGVNQVNWIDGIANEYVAAAAALVLLLAVMK